jgi:hypothetical protein
MEATILVMEVDGGNPVIGKVLGHDAGGALGGLRFVQVHGPVEGIVPHDRMEVIRESTRGDDRINTVSGNWLITTKNPSTCHLVYKPEGEHGEHAFDRHTGLVVADGEVVAFV